jgi:hypothetical protein
MKVPYAEDIASHSDPESCAEARKDLSEALTGEKAGQVLSREIRFKSGAPTASTCSEGHTRHLAKARGVSAPRGRRPCARLEAFCTGTGRSLVCPWEMEPGAAL